MVIKEMILGRLFFRYCINNCIGEQMLKNIKYVISGLKLFQFDIYLCSFQANLSKHIKTNSEISLVSEPALFITEQDYTNYLLLFKFLILSPLKYGYLPILLIFNSVGT